MSYKNVLVAVKTVFQNISVADLSLVLSYHVNFLIQSAHRRLDKSILCDRHLYIIMIISQQPIIRRGYLPMQLLRTSVQRT